MVIRSSSKNMRLGRMVDYSPSVCNTTSSVCGSIGVLFCDTRYGITEVSAPTVTVLINIQSSNCQEE